MVTLPRVLTPDRVLIQDKTGDGAYGPVHSPAREVRHCRVEDGTKLVRDANGDEVVSSARLFLRPGHGPVTTGSLITIYPGEPIERQATVLAAAHHRTPPAPEHYELALT